MGIDVAGILRDGNVRELQGSRGGGICFCRNPTGML